ncbi:MAG: SDR family NAD(P)-dependent oxidoreductase [Eubacteriales bacterium]|nr:SDR family NAD(P)-dependent oxidoreductase [Eubacteriales bacterium]
MKLAGKIAVVTGAAQGIGKGVALEYAKNGADLAILDINGDKLENTAEEIQSLGRRCYRFVGNVADENIVEGFVESVVKEFGKIDILTHCAGILRSCAIVDQDVEDWDAVIAVNLRSSFLFSKYVGKQMKEQGSGAIVLVDSCASKTAEAFNAVYCASKAGVRLLAQSLALELAEYGVRVNSIAPGTINTDMIQRCLHDRAPLYGLTFEEYLKEFNEATPLKRMGEPSEIGQLCVFLVSDDSAFITGSSFNISGGRECH